MTSTNAINAFAEQHSFDAGALQVEELDGIRCAVDCHNAINNGYASLPSDVLEQDMAVGLIWPLYERCTERVYGALVAMTTSCAASSEVLARATIEATVIFRYILGDCNGRLASFFQDHLDQAERQEKQWRREAEQLRELERTEHLAACDYRRQGIAAIKEFVELINSQLVPSGSIPAWPNIALRFQAVGDRIAYRTSYARLCAEPHLDAEETLRYFIGKVMGPELLEAMAVETIMFSRFLLADAVRAYAEAGKEFASSYGMSSAMRTCVAAQELMHRHSINLSNHIGAHPSAEFREDSSQD